MAGRKLELQPGQPCRLAPRRVARSARLRELLLERHALLLGLAVARLKRLELRGLVGERGLDLFN